MEFSIHEAAQKVGISSYTLRYYEKEEIIPKIERNASGHRVYKEEDIEWIGFISCLKSTGMPISELKLFLELYKFGDSTLENRKKLLITHRKRILSKMKKLNESLEKISWKISHYDEMEINIRNVKKQITS